MEILSVMYVKLEKYLLSAMVLPFALFHASAAFEEQLELLKLAASRQ